MLSTYSSEHKIDTIQDHLSNIEAHLERVIPASNVPSPKNYLRLARVSASTTRSPDLRKTRASATYEADVSSPREAYDATANTQSLLASKTVDRAMRQVPSTGQETVLTSALDSLKQILSNTTNNPTAADMRLRRTNFYDECPPPSRIEMTSILGQADSMYSLPRPQYQNDVMLIV